MRFSQFRFPKRGRCRFDRLDRFGWLDRCVRVGASVLFCIALAVVGGTGCGDDTANECTLPEDCPQGYDCVSGQCRPRVGPDGSADASVDGYVADGDVEVDAATVDGDTPDGHVGCEYVDDGVIERGELVFEVGLGATFRVNGTAPVTVDLVGEMSGGERVWDYTEPTPSDRSVVDELLPVSGTWFADEFPNATYCAVLDESYGTLAVYEVTDTALRMLGIVSEEADETLLTYDPPVDILRFPIELGDHYVVETSCTGTFNWSYFNADETYEVTVDESGTAIVPAGSFHVLRIRTNYTQHIPFTMIYTDRIIYAYVTECFGVVARITSQDDETENLFTEAEEYRRMTL